MNVTQAGVSEGFAPASGNYFFLKDGLGSITEVANSTGQVVQRYSYSNFGKIFKIENGGVDKTTNPDIKSPFTYTNRGYDSESGLYYYRARYYDPALGRFLTEDPHPGYIDMPISVQNKYTGMVNNPIRYADPSGEFILETILVSAIVGGTLNAVIYSSMSGGDFFSNLFSAAALKTFAAGAISGALVSGGAMAGLAIGGGIGAAALGGAVGGALGAWSNSAIQGTELTFFSVVLGASLGAVGGAFIGAAVGGAGAFLSDMNRGTVQGLLDLPAKTTPPPTIAPQAPYIPPRPGLN